MTATMTKVAMGKKEFRLASGKGPGSDLAAFSAELDLKGLMKIEDYGDKQHLFKDYAAKMQLLNDLRPGLNNLFAVMALSAGIRFLGVLKLPDHQEPVVDFALAEQPLAKVRDVLAVWLKAAKDRLVADLAAALNWGVQARMIGLFVRSAADPKTGQYYYPLGQSTRESHREAGGVRHIERDLLFVHIHTLVEMELKLLNDLRGAPRRITAVAITIPPLLRPFVRVVTGHMVCEEVKTLEVNRTERFEKWVEPPPVPANRYDPAIVIGPYCLCGWEENEK